MENYMTKFTIADAIRETSISPLQNGVFHTKVFDFLTREKINSLEGMQASNVDCYLDRLSNLPSLDFFPNGFRSLSLSMLQSLDSLLHLPNDLNRLTINACGITDFIGMPSDFTGDIFVHNVRLDSVAGLPSTMMKSLSLSKCGLTSFKGLPSKIHGYASFNTNEILSLVDVHQHLTRLTQNLKVSDNPIIDGWLYVFLIKSLKTLEANQLPERVSKIINYHLRTGMGKAALVKCQLDLINSGFGDYARM